MRVSAIGSTYDSCSPVYSQSEQTQNTADSSLGMYIVEEQIVGMVCKKCYIRGMENYVLENEGALRFVRGHAFAS